MKTLMLIMSLISLMVFSIGCNRSENKSTTGSDIQREESRADQISDEANEDIREEQEDVNEEMQDVRDEQKDVEKEELDVKQEYDDAKGKVKDEMRMED
ncbi:hypothetical protein [Peredibacter starrii]|uniref:Uncharacterized protein n=1 Tax=Peredibacter starrii TaxID=28202 RepID=A0AAX4HUR7_9BACT|nr:hypothetical protein [Peredibacter starrii]WPU66920.1 hypothetical protein SOO65_09175 [Peredibacter starrii]